MTFVASTETESDCMPCTCGRCTSARDEMKAHRARTEEALSILVDRHRAEQLHTPAIRALAAERNRSQRLLLVIGEYLDGKCAREALAFTIRDVVDDE